MTHTACDYYAEQIYTLPISLFDAAQSLQHLLAQPLFLRWRLLHNETVQTGRCLTLVFERSEGLRVNVKGKSLFGGIADGILAYNYQAPRVRQVPYLYRITLKFRYVDGATSSLFARCDEWIDSTGSAMDHRHYAAPSYIRDIGQLIPDLAFALGAR